MSKRNTGRQAFFLGILCLGLVLFSLFSARGDTRQIYKISIETVEEEGVTDGMIDRGLVPYIQRVMEEAKSADAIVLEINTHGGRVDSAVKILDDIRDTNVRTIAFIRRAISAGALVALASDDIVMMPGATIGAATPITVGVGGEANPVGEKYVSYVRAEFRAAATAKGRRADIAEAMVDATLEVAQTAYKFTAESFDHLQTDLEKEGIDKDIVDELLKDLEPLEDEEFVDKDEFLEAVEEQIGQVRLKEYKDLLLKHAKTVISKGGKLLTLTTEEALEYDIRIAEYEASSLLEAVQQVATSVTLTTQSLDALREEGMPYEVVDALQSLKDKKFTRRTLFLNEVEKQIKLSQLERYHDRIWKHAEKTFDFQDISPSQIMTTELNWAEILVRFLTSTTVSSLLMTFGFLGLFIEFRTPGFGLFGTIGLVCLGLFFWGHFLVRLAGWEELLLFVAGLVLLGIELFVIPGFGVVGILGITAIIASLALAMMGSFELITFPDVSSALLKIALALIVSIVVSLLVANALGKIFPRTSIGKRIILSTTQEHGTGYVAQKEERSQLIGMTGVTMTPVHPSGTVVIGEKRYDVVSEGEFIDKNVTVKVTDVEGARIVVRAVDKPADA